MKCHEHQQNEATGICLGCGKAQCNHCTSKLSNGKCFKCSYIELHKKRRAAITKLIFGLIIAITIAIAGFYTMNIIEKIDEITKTAINAMNIAITISSIMAIIFILVTYPEKIADYSKELEQLKLANPDKK